MVVTLLAALLLLLGGTISDITCMWEYVITVTPRQRDVAHCVRGRRRGKKEDEEDSPRRGGARGGRRRRGDTYGARARERVCVRLINQTFAFGCRAAGGRGARTSQAGGTRGRRPGRVVQEAEPGQAKPGRAMPGQAPTSATLSLSLSPHPSWLSSSRAISMSLLRPTPCILLSLSRPVLSSLACLSVLFPRPSTNPLCLPASLTRLGSVYRRHGESTHQSADCGLLNARSHDPASGDIYTG